MRGMLEEQKSLKRQRRRPVLPVALCLDSAAIFPSLVASAAALALTVLFLGVTAPQIDRAEEALERYQQAASQYRQTADKYQMALFTQAVETAREQRKLRVLFDQVD